MTTESFSGRPKPAEYGSVHASYVERVPDGPITAHLDEQRESLVRAWTGFTDADWDRRYRPGKWTVREVVGHVTDLERIFGYRVLVIARSGNSELDLPGHDEEELVAGARWENHDSAALVGEFDRLRGANVRMLSSLTPDAWSREGRADGVEISVRGLAYLMYGHADHHQEVIRNRYLARGGEGTGES